MADVIGIRITAQDDTQGAIASVQRGLGQLNGAASTVNATLAGLGIGISAAGFVAFTQNIINGVDALNDIKDATGATIENISALEDVARRSGTGLDTVSTALVKMNQALSTAKPGSETERAIQALGLSVQQLKAQDPVLAFQSIAQALSGYADDANKARLTQELFGKSLKEVAPLLNDLAEAERLAATMTTEQVKAFEKLNKQFSVLQTNSLTSTRAVMSELMPTLSQLADELIRSQKASDGFSQSLGAGIKTVLQAVAVLVSDVNFVLQGMGREIGAIAAQLVAVGKLDFKGFRAISDAVKEDGERARKELDELQARIMGLNSKGGAGRGSVNPDSVNPTPSVGDFSGPDKAAIAAANRELEQEKKLIAELAGLSGSFAEEWNRLNLMFKLGKLSLEDLTQYQATLLDKQPAMRAAAKALEDAQKDAAKQAIENANDYAKLIEEQEKASEKIRDQVDAERLHVQSLGLSKDAISELAAAKLEDLALTKEQRAETMASIAAEGLLGDAYKEQIDKLKEQAKGLREVAKLKREGAAKEVALEIEKENQKAAEKAASEWQKAAEKIESSITDALMRGFESGKTFAENLRDTVVNMFKTMVLRPTVQAIVVGGMSTAAGLANAATGSSGGAGGLLGSLGGSGFNPIGSLVNWATGGAASAFAGAFSSGLELAAGGFGAEVAAAGSLMMESATGFASFAAGAGQALAGGAASVAAALGPVGLAIGGIALLAALFGGGGRYVQSTGESVSRYDATGALTDRNAVRYGYANNAGADTLVDGLQQSYMAAAKSLGIGLAQTQFSYGGNDAESASGRGKFRVQGWAARAVLDNNVVKGFDSGEIDNASGALELAASRAVLAALSGSSLPKYLTGYLDEITGAQIGAMSQDQVNAVLQTAQQYQQLNASIAALPFENLKDQTYSVYKALTDAAGGMQQFGQSLNTYYTNFYSADEQKAQLVKNLNTALAKAGLEVDVGAFTRAQYRALVEAQDLTTESGRAAYRTLLQLSGSFAQLTQESAAATTAISTAMKKLQDDTRALQVQLLQAQGASAQATAAQRLIDIDGMSAAEIAIYDYNAAIKAQISALDSARSGMGDALDTVGRSVDAQVSGLEAQRDAQLSLLQTQMDGYRAQLDGARAVQQEARSLANNLKSALQDSLGYTADSAMAYLRQALAGAQATGSLPSWDSLQPAVAAAKNISEADYATALDYAMAKGGVSDVIQSLGGYADQNASAADKQVNAIEQLISANEAAQESVKAYYQEQIDTAKAQLDAAKAAVDGINGVNTSVLTVRDALSALGAQIMSLAQAQAAIVSTSAGVKQVINTVSGAAKTGVDTTANTLSDTALRDFGYSLDISTAQAADASSYKLIATAVANGVSASELDKVFGWDDGHANDWAKKHGLPAFALGGLHAGGVRLVGENGPELEVTGPARIFNADQTRQMLQGGGNADMAAEIRALREQVAILQAVMESNTRHAASTAQTLQRVMPDGDALQTRAIA